MRGKLARRQGCGQQLNLDGSEVICNLEGVGQMPGRGVLPMTKSLGRAVQYNDAVE